MKNYYEEINRALKSHEEHKPHHLHNIDWVANRIDWCWKFRKITEEQMEELTNRVVEILKK